MGVLNGIDLILSIGGHALAYSTGCKISTTAETGERTTKEATSGRWKEKFVKTFSEHITADGVTLTEGSAEMPSYDQLKAAMLASEAVQVRYSVREGDTREGRAAGGYGGSFLLVSLELDGPAGDDSKYSVALDSNGPVTPTDGGLSGGGSGGGQ